MAEVNLLDALEEIAVRLIRLEEGMTNVQQVLGELVQALKPPQR